MIKIIYNYNGERVEEECETCLEASILKNNLKENPNVSNIQTIYDDGE